MHDRNFITSMVTHHKSAIDMAALRKETASCQEVKDLCVTIVVAQTKEINRMMALQNEWGYNN